jgi:hypothetical protein
MSCPHCISQQRYPIAIDNISINNQNRSWFLYTSLQHENSPRANSIVILIYSTVQLHLDVSIKIEWTIKEGKNVEIACLQKANTTIPT